MSQKVEIPRHYAIACRPVAGFVPGINGLAIWPNHPNEVYGFALLFMSHYVLHK